MALTANNVTSAGTTVTAAAVPTTSETVAASDIGTNGALLRVINGSGGTITVTIADPGTTAAGNAGTTSAVNVGAGQDKWFRLSPAHVSLSTQVATIAFSAVTSVTYILIRC